MDRDEGDCPRGRPRPALMMASAREGSDKCLLAVSVPSSGQQSEQPTPEEAHTMHTTEDAHMTCGGCHYALAEVCAEEGHFLTHLRPWLNDHAPVPIPAEHVLPLSVCDFCGGDCPSWCYPTRDYAVREQDYSLGDWHACHVCHGLILTEQWDALAIRAVKALIRAKAEAGEPFAIGSRLLALALFESLHEDWRGHRCGPARQVND